MSVILSHAGKQHSYHVAKALLELGLLEKFYTSSYITPRWLQQLIQNNQFWSRRFLPGLSGTKVEANWRFELKEMLYGKLYSQSEKTLNAVYERDVNFDHYMAKQMPDLKGDIFWGFQGSSYESLKAAKRAGKKTICELSTAHAPAALEILGEEKSLHPEWADSFDNLDFPPNYYNRLREEPNLADYVVAASRFTESTLLNAGVAVTKIKYLPLGFDIDRIPFQLPIQTDLVQEGRPLKLLYAGRITQRKGIKYLLEAMKAFTANEVELHLIGHVHGSGQALKAYHNFTLHPPVSQTELFKQYQHYDALVLPSVFEGFGLVIVEAMAAGLPVITTLHTIGPDLIEDGRNGYIVPIRNVDALQNAILDYCKRSGDERMEMRKYARECALKYTWSAYAQRLSGFLKTII